MVQLCRKDKEKIDAADLAFPNLIDDIILTMKKHGLPGVFCSSMQNTL